MFMSLQSLNPKNIVGTRVRRMVLGVLPVIVFVGSGEPAIAQQQTESGEAASQVVPLTITSKNATNARKSADPQADAFGPGDRVLLRAAVWDQSAMGYEDWDVISGSYTLDSEGRLVLPFGGAISLEGHDPNDVAMRIVELLRQQISQLEPPAISIEVEEYAPVYVLGDVARPGAFEARPGLSALQAMALAGGAPRLVEGTGQVRDLMRDGGSLAQLRHQILRLQLRAQRLVAEMDGAESFSSPEGLSHPDGEAALIALMREEQAIFNARREARALETENLEATKELLKSELVSLEAKREGLATQVELAREQVAGVEKLRENGLAKATQIREAQANLFDLESADIDLQNNLFRARQRIQETDRDIVGLRTRLSTEATQELQKVNDELQDANIRRDMLAGLIDLTGFELNSSEEDTKSIETIYYVTHAGEAEQVVAPSEILKRGDVLRVERVAGANSSMDWQN